MIKKIRAKVSLYWVMANNFLWFYTIKGSNNKKRLKELKNIYNGRRCFIIGNGPSLVKCDLGLLKNEITIASNRNYLIWEETNFIPNFLTVEDDLIAENWHEDFNDITNTMKIFPKDLSNYLRLDKNTLYVNFIRNYKNFPKFSFDFLNKAYWGGTVTTFNLQFAYYLGCKEIFLIGCDHNYNVTAEEGTNFVKNAELNNVSNYMHPKYFEKGKKAYLPNVERMELGYIEAKLSLERKGVKVYNATIGGKLEIFERVDYNTLF